MYVSQKKRYQFSSVQSLSCVWLSANPWTAGHQASLSNSLQTHEPQDTRPPCPSPTPGVYPNPCPASWWCHLTISSSVVPFSSCLKSFPTSESFQMSQLFASGGQNIGISASASVLPMNTQDWFPCEKTKKYDKWRWAPMCYWGRAKGNY